jgi:hypothetical protein
LGEFWSRIRQLEVWGLTHRARLRRRLGRAGAVLILVVGASSTYAFNEPDGFRGVPWGASEDVLRARLGEMGPDGRWRDASCFEYPDETRWLGDRACRHTFLLEDIRVDALYAFRDARFVRVLLTFRSADFNRIVAVFVERYGPPTTETHEAFRTQGGLDSVNRILAWLGPNVAITLNRHGGKIAEGAAMVTTQDEIRESNRLRREQLKRSAKE